MTTSYPVSGEEYAPTPFDGLRTLLPKLAQPWWYRLVGYQYAKPDEAGALGLSASEKRAMRRAARKRFRRAAKAAIATTEKRRHSRRAEMLTLVRPRRIA